MYCTNCQQKPVVEFDYCNKCIGIAIAFHKNNKPKINIAEEIKVKPDQIRSSHYGGENNPYEAIKVIDAWNAGFNLGNAIKYICRVCFETLNAPLSVDVSTSYQEAARLKLIKDLKKAETYLEFEIAKLEK